MKKDLDVNRMLGLTDRRVRYGERDGARVARVVAARTYDTDPADLWDALTSRERLPRWFLPVEGDFRVGGRYRLIGNASGTIVACDPPRALSLTWEIGGATSWVTVTLTPDGGRTRLELEHVVPDDDHFRRFGPGAVGVGWDLTLHGLGEHLADAAALDPKQAMAFLTSPTGKALFRASGAAWLEADRAGGAPDDEATKRSAATVAFYTGEG